MANERGDVPERELGMDAAEEECREMTCCCAELPRRLGTERWLDSELGADDVVWLRPGEVIALSTSLRNDPKWLGGVGKAL